VAERSYPMSKKQQGGSTPRPRLGWPRGATQCPISGAMAERSYPTPKLSDCSGEKLSHVQGQGQRPRGATPHPK